MIYDNVNDFPLLKEYYPPDTANGSFIVTIELRKFDPDTSLRLFSRVRKARDSGCDTDSETEATKEVLEFIDGLALGIKQMASFIASKRCTISVFQDKYTTMARYILTRNSLEDTHSLATLWTLQFQNIQATNAFKLLGIIALAHAEDIPRNLLELDEPLQGDTSGWASFCEVPGQ